MHRAGTSAVTQVFVDFGFEVPGKLAEPSPANPKGFWESADFVEIHDEFLHAVGRTWSDPSPLEDELFQCPEATRARERLRAAIDRSVLPLDQWILKDPRMCRLMPLWDDLLSSENLNPHFLHIIRSPLSVAASLELRDGFSQEKSFLLWLRHCLEAEKATRGKDRTWVHFEEFRERSAASVVDRVQRVIGLSRKPLQQLQGTLDRILDPSLVHHRHTKVESLERLQDHPWVARTYRALDSLSTGSEEEARAVLDALRLEVSHADKLLLGRRRSREAEAHDERYYRLGKEIELFHRSVETQRRELEAQRAEIGAMRDAFDAERQRLETIWQDLTQQQAAEDPQVEAEQRQELGLVKQAVHDVARRQESAESQLRVTSRTIESGREVLASIAGSTSAIHELITGRLENRHLTLLSKSLEVVSHLEARLAAMNERREDAGSRRQAAVESQLRGLAASVSTFSEQRLQLASIAESTSTIQEWLSDRLDKRHLTLLHKSLEVISHLETRLATDRQRGDDAFEARETARTERDDAIEQRDRAIAERDRANVERDRATEEHEAAIKQRDQALAERDGAMDLQDRAIAERDGANAQRDRALAERDDAIGQRDRALAERDDANEQRDRAIDQRDRALAERDGANEQSDLAIRQRDGAIAERDRVIAERRLAEVATQAVETALEQREQALAATQTALDQLRQTRSWKLTAPLRQLYAKFKAP